MVDVGRRCFTTGEQNNQTEPTENSTKRQHGRERATIRSRNSRSYEERSGGVSACRRVGVSACRRVGVSAVGATTNRSRHRSDATLTHRSRAREFIGLLLGDCELGLASGNRSALS